MNRRINSTCLQILVLFFLTFIISCSNEKQKENIPLKTDVNEQKLTADLENEISQIMKKALIPGLSIAVIRDGDLLWENNFGVKNIATKDTVTAESIFEAASLSKPVFSYAVMKMVERGELDIDKPLVEYVSDEYIEKNFLGREIEDERFRKITTRMILSHQSGFPNWRRTKPVAFFKPGWLDCGR